MRRIGTNRLGSGASGSPDRIGCRAREDRRPEGDGRGRAARRARARRRAQAHGPGPRGRARARRGRRRRHPRRALRRRRARRSATAPGQADVVAKVAPPQRQEIGALTGESVLVGFLAPLTNGAGTKALAAHRRDRLRDGGDPAHQRARSRWTRSPRQATVSGYRAVLIAAQEQGRFFPMLMTAAGTIPPAQVLVLGAGVAGLQAIATRAPARRRRDRVRRPRRRQGAGPVARREVPRGRGQRRRRGGRRLRARADRGGAAGPARRARRADREVRRRHHHRARARPPGAEADHRGRGERDEARQRDRRPRRRGGRQLRADAAGRDLHDRQGRDDRLAAQPAEQHGRARLAALRAQRRARCWS